MTLARLLVRRVALGIFAAWAVFTGVFALFTLTDDWRLGAIEGGMRYAGMDEDRIDAVVSEYLDERGIEGPWHEAYLEWMIDMFTLQWGVSFETNQPVRELIWDAILQTAAYAIPGVVVAVIIGTLIGLFVAMNRDSRVEGGLRALVYAMFGVPTYWIAAFIVMLFVGDVAFDISRRLTVIYESPPSSAVTFGLGAVLIATVVLAGQVSYSRAYSLEYLSADYVTLLRAKGAGRVTMARHVLKNVSLPLLSLVFTEMIGLLVMAVFVIEFVLSIEGIGVVLLQALWHHDLPVVFAATIVVLFVAIAGNIVQDVAYRLLDPRIDS